MVGLDTGFFIALMKGEKEAFAYWDTLSRQEIFSVVSILTLGELLYIGFRTGKPKTGMKMVENIKIIARVVSVDFDIIEKAASVKAGRGIPYIDAIILATFLLTGCTEIHTTDRKHFSGIKNKGVKTIYYSLGD